MKFPLPIRAEDVLKHDKGRHVGVRNRRTWWQIWHRIKHEGFWLYRIVKSEYQWMRKEWFRWLEK